MKLYDDDRTWELKPRDLRKPAVLSKLASEARPGDFIYAPAALGTFAIEDRFAGDEPEDLEDRDPVKPTKPDPRRVDALREALRARGFDLEDQRCFYWLIVETRSTGQARAAS